MAASETVIREVTQNVWTFSKPFSRFGLAPIGGRSTAVKLQSGDVWLLASTPASTETRDTLDKLGPVKYIVAVDIVHNLYIADFKQAYPNAKVIGVDGLSKHLKGQVKFDGEYGKDAPSTKYGFEPEITACYFSGFKNKDVAFLHGPSKTLIEGDLLMNLPPVEQYSKSKAANRLPIIGSLFSLNPWTKSQKYATWSLGVDKEAMKRDAKTVAGWDFNRLIPCHGDVIEGKGKEAFLEAYKWYLE